MRLHVLAEMTNGGVGCSAEHTGHIDATVSAFECVQEGPCMLVCVPHKDAVCKTHPMNLLGERTLKGTSFGFGDYRPCSDLSSALKLYMKKENPKRKDCSLLGTLHIFQNPCSPSTRTTTARRYKAGTSVLK